MVETGYQELELLVSRCTSNLMSAETLSRIEQKCVKCGWKQEGDCDVVWHYVHEHPECEVPVRLSSEQVEQVTGKNYNPQSASGAATLGTLYCRFCKFQCPSKQIYPFRDHVSSHTGEYQYTCHCGHKDYSMDRVRKHATSKHGFASARVLKSMGPVGGSTLYGYMCAKCGYVQIEKERVDDHLKPTNERDRKCVVLLNLSGAPELNRKIQIKRTRLSGTDVD